MSTLNINQIALDRRIDILNMVYKAKSGHIGGSFSATELMVVLFYKYLRHNPKKPLWENRDYFILSKGHTTPIYYSILADLGYFSKELLNNFRQLYSPLHGHPKTVLAGIEASTGSLGQGFGNAAGIALGLKVKKSSQAVITLLGDGEIQEGVVWETAMAIGHFKLTNLLTIIDFNSYQTDGNVVDIMNINPVIDKFIAFGFEAYIIDGHNIEEISSKYEYFYQTYTTRKKPLILIAKTVKGKGVSFMENTSAWHGKAPLEEEYHKAFNELTTTKIK